MTADEYRKQERAQDKAIRRQMEAYAKHQAQMYRKLQPQYEKAIKEFWEQIREKPAEEKEKGPPG